MPATETPAKATFASEETPLARLLRENLLSSPKVRSTAAIKHSRWYRLLRGEVELTLAEADRVAKAIGVEVRELLPSDGGER